MKRVRRVGGGYADYDEVEDTDHGVQYGRKRAAVNFGFGDKLGRFGGSKGNTAFGIGSYGGTPQRGILGNAAAAKSNYGSGLGKARALGRLSRRRGGFGGFGGGKSGFGRRGRYGGANLKATVGR